MCLKRQLCVFCDVDDACESLLSELIDCVSCDEHHDPRKKNRRTTKMTNLRTSRNGGVFGVISEHAYVQAQIRRKMMSNRSTIHASIYDDVFYPCDEACRKITYTIKYTDITDN